MDYLVDPLETDPWESWNGVDDLIAKGVETNFGEGTTAFLEEADRRQEYMKTEIIRRYGMENAWRPF